MYKKIIYFLISFFYPLPKKIRKPYRTELLIKKINKIFYKVFQLENARLYTDTIHNFGIIKDKYLIDGPSYQYINNNLSHIRKNKILENGTPRKMIYLKGSVLSLLSGGGANKNYFHWLFDVLPKLYLFEQVHSLKKIDYFLFPNLDLSFQKQTLRLLNINRKKCLSSIDHRHIFSDKIFVTSHPYVLNFNSKYGSRNIPDWISSWLKKRFLKFSSNKFKYDKIYIDRKIKNTFNERYLINNREIRNYLTKKDFKILYLEDYSFKDQISIFKNAKIIIGLHGAGFANIVFCKKGTKIIEILNKSTGPQIKNLAEQNNLKYTRVIGISDKNSHEQGGSMKISLNYLKKKLNNYHLAG